MKMVIPIKNNCTSCGISQNSYFIYAYKLSFKGWLIYEKLYEYSIGMTMENKWIKYKNFYG